MKLSLTLCVYVYAVTLNNRENEHSVERVLNTVIKSRDRRKMYAAHTVLETSPIIVQESIYPSKLRLSVYRH